MHNLIIDVCQNSSPENGIFLSERFLNQLKIIKDFNYEKIYNNSRFKTLKKYSELVLTEIFEILYSTYDERNTWEKLNSLRGYCPTLIDTFEKWLIRYCEEDIIPPGKLKTESSGYVNTKIYGRLENERIYAQAIIDFIAGMTDRFAVKLFNELITY